MRIILNLLLCMWERCVDGMDVVDEVDSFPVRGCWFWVESRMSSLAAAKGCAVQLVVPCISELSCGNCGRHYFFAPWRLLSRNQVIRQKALGQETCRRQVEQKSPQRQSFALAAQCAGQRT